MWKLEIPVKVRNWHKRNLRAANEIEATVYVVASSGSDHPVSGYPAYGQIRIKRDDGSHLNIDMTPEQFKALARQMQNCLVAFERNDVSLVMPGTEYSR